MARDFYNSANICYNSYNYGFILFKLILIIKTESMPENLIFLLGLIIFASATLIFYFLKKKNDYLVLSRLVFFTTTVSYMVLLSGIWVINNSLMQSIYPTRWLFYILSCSLLMYEIGKILNKTFIEKLEMVILNILVMFTGFLASIMLSPYKWLFFVISAFAFIVLLRMIKEKSGKQTKFMKDIRCFVKLTWILFPIVWFFAPTGIGLFSAMATAFLYLCLDITTKIIFGYYCMKGKF